MNNNVVMIKRELLHPHPDNPRKDLGDLSELRESIKEHGVMQNLTVTHERNYVGPDLKDDYIILIGHRRFAASEGILDELPCVIVDGLTDREQVGIMLCENMQRSDLTYIEQAHGFQMMLDLGDTIQTISEKTGFSKTTIKHRIEIAKLSDDALKEAQDWFQPTLTDFIELEKVKDIDKRNEILEDSTCSKELQEAVKDYLEEELHDANYAYYAKIFNDAGWKEVTQDKWFYYHDEFKRTETALDSIDLDAKLIPEKSVKKLIDGIKGEIHFGRSYRSIQVRKFQKSKKESRDEAEAKQKAKEAQLKKNKRALRDIQAEMCDSYMELIINSTLDHDVSNSTLYCLLDCAREASCTLYNLEEKVKYTTTIVSKKGYENPENNPMSDFADWTPVFQLLGNIYWSLANSYNSFVDYAGRANKELLTNHKVLQDILKDEFDYHPRKEWETILDGTSELYVKEAKK